MNFLSQMLIFLYKKTDGIPSPGLLSATIPTNALVINVVAFVLLSRYDRRGPLQALNFQEDLLGRYVTPVVAILAVFNLTAFGVDLALLTAVKKAFGTTATVNVGNGTWLTLFLSSSFSSGYISTNKSNQRQWSMTSMKNNCRSFRKI